jgi:hypothetical protein
MLLTDMTVKPYLDCDTRADWKARNCGGPMKCRHCAMIEAVRLFRKGNVRVADLYRIHAEKLRDEALQSPDEQWRNYTF